MKAVGRYIIALLSLGCFGCEDQLRSSGEFAAPTTPDSLGGLAIASESPSARLNYAQAERARLAGRHDLAMEYYDLATAADPEFTQAWVGRARLASGIEARLALLDRAASTTAADLPDVRPELDFEIQLLEGDLDAALATARELARTHRSSARAAVLYARALRLTNDVEGARGVLRSPALEGSYEVGQELTRSFLFDWPTDARAALRQARHLVERFDPPSPAAYLLLGDAHVRRGDSEAALEAFRTAELYDLATGNPAARIGHLHTFEGRYEQAREAYRRAVGTGSLPQRARHAISLALVHVHAGDPAEAVRALLEVSDAWGETTWPLAERASLRLGALLTAADVAAHHELRVLEQRAVDRAAPIAAGRTDRLTSVQVIERLEMENLVDRVHRSLLKADTATAIEVLDQLEAAVQARPLAGLERSRHQLRGQLAALRGQFDLAIGHYELSDLADPWTRLQLALAYVAVGQADEAEQLRISIVREPRNGPHLAMVRRTATGPIPSLE